MKHDLADRELIKRCLFKEDREAWEIFVRRYSRLIWKSIHKTFFSNSFPYVKEDAEDIYSDLFLSLTDNNFSKLRQYRGDNACAVSTWLTVIAVRMTIDYMRKDKRGTIVKSTREDMEVWEAIPDNKYRADKLVEEKQKGESFRKSLSVLSPRDRMIYDLLFNRGYSPEETAKTLGLSISIVYSRKHRIIEKIKENIKGM
jgi:RNA polymerase sigma-70 factor (ECF subfamily)